MVLLLWPFFWDTLYIVGLTTFNFQILGNTVICLGESGHLQMELDRVDALFHVFE